MNAYNTIVAEPEREDEADIDARQPGGDPEFRFSRQIVVLSDPSGGRSEAIGALRTHLLAQHRRDRRRSLAVCAPTVGVGCTFMATNLAVSLSMAGVRTLLIDANMRQPGLDALIVPEPGRIGLRQCLAESDVALGDAICHDVLPDLSVLFAGGVAENAQELLAGADFKTMMAACMRDFELVLVDTPASNTCADARIVAATMRYAMIVARRNDTYIADVRTLVKDLTDDRATVIGSFLNDF